LQNRYVADIGDYVKLAILRALAFDRRMGVAWWRFPDEPRKRDGAHREYLERPNEWKHFDPVLFEALSRIEREKKRDVRAIEEAGILPNAVFASDEVPCKDHHFLVRPTKRLEWLEKIKTKLRQCDLVFLDPDNGIASEWLRLTRQYAGKSVTIGEMKELQNGTRPMVVYHHQTRRRGGHSSEICDLAARLRESGLNVSGALRAKPWSPRVFFMLNADRQLRERAKSIAELWGSWISWHPDVEILKGSI
jgi:hypothetical protein